jgi:hypothetical protein
MTSLARRRWAALPSVVRVTLGMTATAVGYGLGYVVVAGTFGLDPRDDSLAIWYVMLALLLPFAVVGVFRQRRRLGGKGQLGLYRQAYRTGTLPDEADVEKWRPIVRRHASRLQESRWIVIAMQSALAAVLVTAPVVVAVQSLDHLVADLAVIAVAVAVVALVAWGWDRLWRRRMRQVERLELKLAHRT